MGLIVPITQCQGSCANLLKAVCWVSLRCCTLCLCMRNSSRDKVLAGHTRWQILEVTVKRPEVVAVEKRKPTVSHLILKRCSLVSSSLYLAIFVPCFESVHDMKPLSSVNASALLLITTTHTHTQTPSSTQAVVGHYPQVHCSSIETAMSSGSKRSAAAVMWCVSHDNLAPPSNLHGWIALTSLICVKRIVWWESKWTEEEKMWSKKLFFS